MSNLLITGGTSGIGLNYLKKYLDNYENIFVLGRNDSNIKSIGVNFISYDFLSDYTNFDFVQSLPKLDKLVFSAGFVSNNPLMKYDSNNTNSVVNVNLLSQLNLFGKLYSAKKLNNNASVVFISSLLGCEIGMFAGSAYAASKAGLSGAVKVLAIEAARKGIRVNSIAPGMVESPLTNNLNIGHDLLNQDRAKYPLGKKYLSEEEVSDVVNFLLSDSASAITGQNLVVDRGFTLK